MPYLGNEPADTFTSIPTVQQFNGDASTTAFTLNRAVGSDQQLLVSVDGVIQDTAAYAVSNGTTLTFSAAPSQGTANIFVNHLGLTIGSVVHPASSALAATTGTFSSTVTGAGTSVFASLDISGDIDVDGTTNLDVVDIDGALTQDGGAVFNEASADVDFRVESNNSAAMFFVDGSEDVVGIGTVTPVASASAYERAALHIHQAQGGSTGSQIHLTNAATGAAAGNGVFIAMWSDDDLYITNQESDGNIKFASGGNADVLGIDANGHVTMPKTSAFSAIPSSQQANFAINASVAIAFGTEVYDQNADFASNAFTAPVTGKYVLNTSIRLSAVDSAADYYHIQIVTSNRSYQNIFDPDFGQDAAYWALTLSCVADMDAGDTAYVAIVQGGGTQQTDIEAQSHFSGYLAC
jgi:hypothetical protein